MKITQGLIALAILIVAFAIPAAFIFAIYWLGTGP